MKMIEHAAEIARLVDVVVLGWKGEPISMIQRYNWVSDTYVDVSYIHPILLGYDPNELNSSSESDLQSSIEWAEYLKANLYNFDKYDVIVGSEKYVQYMGEYLGIDYDIFDEGRKAVSISATAIKSDIVNNWDYLAPAVKRTYAKHICIVGSESTGKTTVCRRIEDENNFVTAVYEIGRSLVGKSELCTKEKLISIFNIHALLLNEVRYDPPTPIVIWDTDNIITKSYYKFLFDSEFDPHVVENIADKYFFFDSNIPVVDDGSRFDENTAKSLKDCHISMYDDYGVDLEMVTENRYEVVNDYVQRSIEELKNIFTT
jgi:HTH-type transcriptional repressor of NAD biosynthesis genes